MGSSYTLCIGRKEGFQLNLSLDLYLQRKLSYLENILQETVTKMHIGMKERKYFMHAFPLASLYNIYKQS